MTAQELYRMYREAWAKQNCDVETWDDLTPEDRAAWEDVAAGVRETYGV